MHLKINAITKQFSERLSSFTCNVRRLRIDLIQLSILVGIHLFASHSSLLVELSVIDSLHYFVDYFFLFFFLIHFKFSNSRVLLKELFHTTTIVNEYFFMSLFSEVLSSILLLREAHLGYHSSFLIGTDHNIIYKYFGTL